MSEAFIVYSLSYANFTFSLDVNRKMIFNLNFRFSWQDTKQKKHSMQLKFLQKKAILKKKEV